MGYCHLDPHQSGDDPATSWRRRPAAFGSHELDPEFDEQYVAVYADPTTKVAYVCMRGHGNIGTTSRAA